MDNQILDSQIPRRYLDSRNLDSQNRVRATVTVRVMGSYDCPAYGCPYFDCTIMTSNQGTAALPTVWLKFIVLKRLDGSRCDLVWTMEVRVGPDHIVLHGNPAPP